MEEMRPVEILLSNRQLDKITDKAFHAVVKGIDKADKAKVQKDWMKQKDLVEYLPIVDSTIREHLPDLPFHVIGGTKFYNKNEVDEYLLKL